MQKNKFRLSYPGMVPDDKCRRFVPPVRLVRECGNVRNAARLLNRVNIQSFCSFSPDPCVIPPGGELLLDFGIELHGQLTVNSDAMQCSALKVTFGESVSEALGTPTTDHAPHQELLTIPMLGQVNFGNTAFRFVRLEVPADRPEVKLTGVCATAIYRDWEYVGYFDSDDERLNRIWHTGAYTVHLNCQDYIYDGVKRDRLVWMGDLYPEIRTLLAVFEDTELIEKSLDFVRDRTPRDKWMNTASSYSCWWIICLRDFYRARGNYSYLKSQKAELFALLNRLLACIAPDGSEALTEWRFLDWSTAEDDAAKHAGLQGLLAWTLDSGAELALELNHPRLARRCAAGAARLRTVAPECGGNKIAAAMQILGKVADPLRLNAEIMRHEPARGISTFYGYFVLLARAHAGDLGGALDVIRDYWGAMLDFGATTFWEDFDLDWTENAYGIDRLPVPGKQDIHGDFGKHCYRGLRHSLCHGWAGGPTAFLSEHVLGVTPAAPGYVAARISPALPGLTRVEGAVPTPFGPIEVSARAVGNRIRKCVKLPGEIRELR